LEGDEIGDELVRILVGVRRIRHQPAQHAREELPKNLAWIARLDRRAVAAAIERRCETDKKRLGYGHTVGGHAQAAQQAVDLLMVAPQRSLPAALQSATRDFGRDERVAVAVAADPGAEAEEERNAEFRLGVMAGERRVEPLEQLGDTAENGLVEEV